MNSAIMALRSSSLLTGPGHGVPHRVSTTGTRSHPFMPGEILELCKRRARTTRCAVPIVPHHVGEHH